MAEQRRKDAKSTKSIETEECVATSANLSKKGEDLKKEMDAMVDEIDDILEQNAEEFVASYVQRGGQ